ncbi:hypothetical protein AAC387_Pa06g1176 [Persea americana]
MNDFKSRKSRDSGKPVPGCLGRMVNLFDLGPGMGGNRLLTEKAHRDASLHRSQIDLTKKALDPIRDQNHQMKDQLVEYELKRNFSNKKSNGTPVKMLIAQEMSKETESKQKPTTVVAKLMGLDGLPALQPISTAQQSLQEGYLQNASTKPGSIPRYQHENRGFLDKQAHCDTCPSQACIQEKTEYKDVSEVWQRPLKIHPTKDQLQPKGIFNGNSNDDKMALVRQKFIEAKRLATDEKLRQSKEFQDALEVLSSNRDLFVKFLQEPNSLFSTNLCEHQSSLMPLETKHITVLKPSKMVEADHCAAPEVESQNEIKKEQVVEANNRGKYKASWSSALDHQRVNNTPHPTRIVVLKPSLGKTHDIKAIVPSPTSSPRFTYNRDFCVDYEAGSTRGSREIAKEITRQMRESLSGDRRDESFLSSILSNGYVGDESSFNRSENYFIEGNLSDLEITSPTSRHSWDCMNRNGSPYSSSSFGRASYSTESSVAREAKKRLSERWAMMSSTGGSQEQRQIRRSSSTLGEMLTLSNNKKHVISGEEGDDKEPTVSSSWLCGGEQELRGAVTCLSISGEDSPRTFSRSRSVPVSSTAYEARSNVESPDPRVSWTIGKSPVLNELTKSKNGKLSLKGKVSSLFFSRNKKPSKEKSCQPPSVGSPYSYGYQSNVVDLSGNPTDIKQFSVGNRGYETAECVMDGAFEDAHPLVPGGSSCKPPSPYIWAGPKRVTFTSEAVPSFAKIGTPENSSENQDQPSPISVLEASFGDLNIQSKHIKTGARAGLNEHLCCHESELTVRSPIDTVSRSLSWDDESFESSTENPLEPSTTTSKAELEEKECLLFVQTLLSAAGLDYERCDGIYAIWHSPVSPLDPLLLEKCTTRNDYEQHGNEAKRRQWRSERKLLFDCVNATLLDMARATLSRSCGRRAVSLAGAPVTEEVWCRVREWFSTNTSEGDVNLLVERVVRKEVTVGKGWEEEMGLEAERIGEEIERALLEQLVEEAFLGVAS